MYSIPQPKRLGVVFDLWFPPSTIIGKIKTVSNRAQVSEGSEDQIVYYLTIVMDVRLAIKGNLRWR